MTRLTGHTDYVRSSAASPSSHDVFVTGSFDHSIRLWDVRQKACVLQLPHGAQVEDVCFLPGGGLLATAGGSTICIWDILGGGCARASEELGAPQGKRRRSQLPGVSPLCFSLMINVMLTTAQRLPQLQAAAALHPRARKGGDLPLRRRRRRPAREAQRGLGVADGPAGSALAQRVAGRTRQGERRGQALERFRLVCLCASTLWIRW